MLASWPS